MENSIVKATDGSMMVVTQVKGKLIDTSVFFSDGITKCTDDLAQAFIGNSKITLDAAVSSGALDTYTVECFNYILKGLAGI
jgi:hypothetical protein